MAEKTFTVVFKKSPDYKIYLGQTIYGGPVPDSSGVLMNICVDHTAFPNYLTHPVSEDGKTVDTQIIQDQVQIGNIEREVLCGIYLTVDQAKRTMEWLNKVIQKIERGRHE